MRSEMFATAIRSHLNHNKNMVWLSRRDVPVYLRKGSFYNNLDAGDEELFEVPDQCCKWNAKVSSDSDLKFLLHTLRFWGVSGLPLNAVGYLCMHKNRNCMCEEIMRSFPELQDVWKQLGSVMSENVSIAKAIRLRCGVDATRALFWRGDQKKLSAEDCVAAATVDDLQSLAFLREHCCPWDDRTTTAAVVNGSALCLQYALTNRCLLKSGLMELALVNGQVESAKCLLRNGIRITSALASQNWTDVGVLCFLHQLGYSTPFLTCELCARQNRVDVLQYLLDLGHPWGNTCTAAARAGSLECLVYAHTRGCPWDAFATTFAALRDNVECLRYAFENGCPVNVDPRQILEAGSYTCTIYLVNKRYKVGEFAWAMLCMVVTSYAQHCFLVVVVVPFGLVVLSVSPCLMIIAFVLVVFVQGVISLVYTQTQYCASIYEDLRDWVGYYLFHLARACLFVVFSLIVCSVAVSILIVYSGVHSVLLALDCLWFGVSACGAASEFVMGYFMYCAEPILVPTVVLFIHVAKMVK